jgi:Rha family phage regulatory protein
MEKSLHELVVIVKNGDGVPVVTSMEVAKRFGKDHFHVMRDIETLMNQGVRVASNFGCSSYKASNGKTYRSFEMNRDGFSLLAMGFTGSKAVEWKLAFLDAFNMMIDELGKRQPTAINVRDHGQLAEITLQLIEVNKELKEEMAELKPDAEGMRLLRSGNGEFTLTQVAKMLEVKRPWLFDLLTEAGWLYVQNGVHQPYAPLMKQGLLTVDPRKGKAVMRTNGAVEVKVTTLVTPKGLAKITEIVKAELKKEAQIERDEDDAILERLNHDDRIYGSGDD